MRLINSVIFPSFVNQIAVNDSPYSERMERKDSIRRFLREQFRDDKKKEQKEKDKESKESKENKENVNNANAASTASSSSSATAASSESAKANTETKSKSSAYRLFRTVSIDIDLLPFNKIILNWFILKKFLVLILCLFE